MDCERTQQRQPCRRLHAGKCLLAEQVASRNKRASFAFSVGRMCIIAIIIAMIGTHTALANAKSVNSHLHQPFHLSRLRGGSSNDGNLRSGGGESQLNDEDLDDYIDFLLAYADDKATEADNPLFRDEVDNEPLLEDTEEVTAVEESDVGIQQEEEETIVEEDLIEPQESSATIVEEALIEPQESGAYDDAAVEPLVVDDVDDDAQLDAMVDSLVASIDDSEIEGEISLEDDTSATIIQEEEEINEAAEDNELSTKTSQIETAEELSEEPTIVEDEINVNGFQEVDSAFEAEVLVESTIDVDVDVEDATLEAATSAVEVEVEVEVPVESTIDLDVEDVTLEATFVESTHGVREEEQVDEEEIESETFYLGSSAVENMPLPVNEEASSAGTVENDAEGDVIKDVAEITTEPTKRVPLFTSLMQKIGLKDEESQLVDSTIVDSTEQIEEETIVAEDIDQDETTEIVLDSRDDMEEYVVTISDSDSRSPDISTLGEPDISEQIIEEETSEASAVVVEAVGDQATKTPYQRFLGNYKDWWGIKRWYGHREPQDIDEGPPERDYNKIYEKYFATNHQISSLDEPSPCEQSNRLSSAFLRPWGTVTRYFKPKEFGKTEDSEISQIDYYSIGIKSYVTENSTRDTPGETEDDIEIATAFVEGSEEIVDTTEIPTDAEDLYVEVDTGETSVDVEDPEVEVLIEELSVDTEVTTEDNEVEVGSEEVPVDTEDIIENIGAEVDSEDVLADTEAIIESTGVEVDSEVFMEGPEFEVVPEEVLEDAEIFTEGTQIEIDSEDILVEAEIVTESTDVEVDSEDSPAYSEIITEDAEVEVAREEDAEVIIEVEFEVDSEEVPEEVEVITEVDFDVECDEVSEVITEVEIDNEEVSEVITEITEVEIDSEEVSEVITEVTEVEIDSEDVPDDAEFVSEVEVDSEDVPEYTKLDSEEVPEYTELVTEVEIEIGSEGVPEYTELVTEVEVEVDSEEVLEYSELVTEEADSVEVFMNREATLVETDQLDESSKDSPVEVHRRPNIFTRIWGTTKVPTAMDTVEVDSEMTEIVVEETEAQIDHSTGAHDIIREESSRQPNILIRLWGTTREPNEIYSLGLQGIKELDGLETRDDDDVIADSDMIEALEEVEDTDMSEGEEKYVDLSVSIDIVEEREESLESLEISDWSGVEDIEDERHVLQLDIPERQIIEEERDALQLDIPEIQEIEETVQSENAPAKDMQPDRNVFQLHISERLEIEEQRSNENDERSTLQLHQDNSLSVPGSSGDIAAADHTFEEVSSESELEEIQFDCYPDDFEEDSEELTSNEIVDNNVLKDEEDSIEEHVNGFTVDGTDQYVVSNEDEQFTEELDDEEPTEVSIVTDAEDFSAQENEEEDVELFVADSIDEMISEEEEDSIEQEQEIEEDVEEDVSIEISEDEGDLEDVETDESEGEEEFYLDEIDEDESLISDGLGSAPFSLEVEMQNSNFLSRFLVNKGLEQLIMIAIVIAEWFRVYIFAPFLDSIDWIVQGKGQDLVETVMNIRGGALVSTLSDSEDADQTVMEEEIEKEEEETLSTEEQRADLSDADKPESDSLKDIRKGDTEQDDLVQSEKSSPDTAPIEKPLPAQRQAPPNFIFRRLVHYGVVGHVLIMEMILASEWMKLYVPQIRSISNYIVYNVLKKKKYGGRSRGPDNYMDGGFVNVGDGSRLTKPKKQRKKEDQRALDQLKRVGNVNEARYSFVSQRFMKRHGLGPYRVAVSEIEVDLESTKRERLSNKNDVTAEEDETESDSRWILDALGVDEDDADPSSVPFDTNVGVSMGSDGSSVSIGFDFNVGKKKGKRGSSQKLRNVIVGSGSNSISSKRKKPLKPHVSDNESGLMGRLRAQGANSLVGRSLLGAYPGDLPSPEEAADSRGVIDLARRYGYGDWSDNDDEADEYSFGGGENDEDEDSFSDYSMDEDECRPKKRSTRRSRTKKRRPSSSRNKQTVGVGFDIALGSSSQEPVSLSNVSTNRRKRSSASTSVSSSISDSVSSSGRRRRRKSSSSRLPSLAMETIGGISGSRSASSKSQITPADLAQKIERKRRTLRPAMSILDKTKEATGSTSTESQNEDQ